MSPDKEIRIRLSRIKRRAEVFRAPEYEQEWLARGRVEGGFLIATLGDRKGMQEKWLPRGLGDLVAIVAQPVARTIKAVTGGVVDLANCGGCKQRQEGLNRLVPNPAAETETAQNTQTTIIGQRQTV